MRFSCLVILICTTLTACAVNAEQEVATYRDQLEKGAAQKPSLESEQPLTVRESMILANYGNEILSIEGENYLQAIIQKRRAAAAFLPIIRLSPSYTFEDNPNGGTRTNFDLPVEAGIATTPLRDSARVESASANIEFRLAGLFDQQDSLLIDVARTHYEVIRAERAVLVLENSLRVQDERVRDAEARLEAGLVRPLDLSQTRSQAAQTASELIVARNRVRTARSMLNFLTAAPVSGRALADSLDELEPSSSMDALIEVALNKRMDLVAAGHRIEVARKLVHAAYGEYFPSVAVNLEVFLSRQSAPENLDWSSLIKVSLPLFAAGLIEADVREALSFLRQSRLQDSWLRRKIRQEIESSFDQYKTAADRVAQIKLQTDAARQALDQSEGLYQVGLATNLERLAAQDTLLSAQLQLVNAELDRKVFFLDLLRNEGILHEMLGLDRSGVQKVAQGDNDAEAR